MRSVKLYLEDQLISTLVFRFKLDWGTYLATSEDVIYAVIDGRGSGYRGDDLLFEIYYKVHFLHLIITYVFSSTLSVTNSKMFH